MLQAQTISREVRSVGTTDDPSETTRRSPSLEKKIKAYLQGALHDASLNKRKRYRFTQKGDEWLLELKKMFEKLEYRAWIYKEGSTRDVYALETLAEFLDFRFDPLSLSAKEEQGAYIRGFFDAEGGIPHQRKARFYIQLVQKDLSKIQKIKSILDRLGIATGAVHNPSKKVDPNYWRIFVSAKSYQRFAEVIGSSHPRKRRILQKRMKI